MGVQSNHHRDNTNTRPRIWNFGEWAACQQNVKFGANEPSIFSQCGDGLKSGSKARSFGLSSARENVPGATF
jgi:hypothetical protein